jgi:hypothetical protein
LETESSYAGLSNVELEPEVFDLGSGLTLRKTFAHLAAHNIMAFAPAKPGKHHPGPWRAAQGGYAFDIYVELHVPHTELPGGLSTDDTIWIIAALLRLAWVPFLQVPIISDRKYAAVARSSEEPMLRPFEIALRRMKAGPDAHILTVTRLEWLRDKWARCASMIARDNSFRTALRALDQCMTLDTASSSLLMIWGGLEQLFCPTAAELRYRVSSNIAAFLEPPGGKRLELFREILKLYNSRSRAAHTAAEVDYEAVLGSFVIMRNALMKMINDESVPSQALLEKLLFSPEPTAWDPKSDDTPD